MTSFKELNNNLNEYNLIRKVIEYSGKQNCLHDEYERLIIKYKCDLTDPRLYKKEKLSIEFIRYFKDELNWLDLIKNLKNYYLNNIEFIKEFNDRVLWEIISEDFKKYNFDNIEFIREFKNKIHWFHISENLKKYNFNNIEFIREFKDKIVYFDVNKFNIEGFNFNNIELLKEFTDYIEWNYIIKSKEDYKKFEKILNTKNKIFLKMKLNINN